MAGLTHPYQYVVLRCVPRADREEFVNLAVVLYCQGAEFIDVAVHINPPRLTALAAELDIDSVCRGLDFVRAVCAGRAGPGADSDFGTRFGFIKAPRSTVVRPGPVHGGITDDPAATMEALVERLVR